MSSCAVCSDPITQPSGRGRRRKYCSRRCGQRAADLRRASPCSRCGELVMQGPGSLDVRTCRSCRSLECSRCGKEFDEPTPGCCVRCETERRHGLELGDFDQLLATQGGRCAVCRTDDPGSIWVIDHDHDCCPGTYSCGECVRGLLCQSCNKGLGMFGDDPAHLARAITYLSETK